jgi:NlpC/P60 family putative phage cell wall peptidase
MPGRSDVVAEARTWIGTSFQHQGRLRGVGVDCVGLVIGVARALGLADGWREQPYRKFPSEDFTRAVLGAHLVPVDGAPRLGDVALIRWRNTANHMAVIGDAAAPFSLVHAYYVPGRVVEHRADTDWCSRIVALYRYRGLT